jgi:peptidoglycan hydrolase-like protein with peptidoglycan-binding domain
VLAFQAAHGLSQDGVVGPNTWRALAAASNGSSPAPAAPSSSGQPTLSEGATGSAVSTLQKDLAADGFSPGSADGAFGPNTLRAVDAFQQANGLSVDGVVGPQTWNALAHPKSVTSTPPSSSGAEPTIYEGSSGSAVATLQQLLTKAGYSTQGVDGDFGPDTRAALLDFQSSHGLSADGICGPMTWAALESAKPGAPTPTGNAGGDAALVARGFLGETEYQLEPSGALDMDTWVPKSEDCANFVSGCLEKAGDISHSQRSDLVTQLASNLESAGWTLVPLADAKPGDVCCFDGPDGPYQHVELFNGWVNGTPQYIGSNNILADGTQEISTDNGAWANTVHVLQPPA